MVYEFVLKLFGRSAVDLISLLPFLFSLEGDQFGVEVRVKEPCTAEMVRLIESYHDVTLHCELSLVVNEQYRFRQRQRCVLHYDSLWWSDGSIIGSSPPDMESFRFTFSGFRFDPGDRIDLFSVVTIENDTLFEQSTGFTSSVLWNYVTPLREETVIYENGAFISVDD